MKFKESNISFQLSHIWDKVRAQIQVSVVFLPPSSPEIDQWQAYGDKYACTEQNV